MFNSFKNKLPEISIFHHASSPPSNKALNLLRAAISSPYPSTNPAAPPLQYNLEVVESPPNKDQLNTILSYLPSKATSPSMAFLSAHPASGATPEERPQTVEAIAELAQKNPRSVKWPIVVNWNDGTVAVGDVEDVKRMLEKLRKKRDGEV
ncbi:hypothetical protein FA15DRAFT_245755 [Coprinopsis marcescibilis]|uniref:Thioredoxin-like protein n=1 Tax=Coprinopsis marcescibilis TaxID=230819 RepID=A0A5C3L2Z8_COPMA|nr:hypothetical protein FA15DRAFT_245755 [Coprinopsis marcescibilis]